MRYASTKKQTKARIRKIRASHYARGVAEERARVVAWMRLLAPKVCYGVVTVVADRIERGEHEGLS